MEELWNSGTLGRITANVIGGISVLVALYLFYIAYKKLGLRWLKGTTEEIKYATVFDLNPPYARGKVQFGIELEEETEVQFQIVNIKDEVCQELLTDKLNPGVHPIYFDTLSLEDGEYFYQLITPKQKTTKKFFIVNKVS